MTLVTKLTSDVVDTFVKELKKEENQKIIETTLVDPLIEHIIYKIKPFIILMVGLFIIIIIMIAFILYLSLF